MTTTTYVSANGNILPTIPDGYTYAGKGPLAALEGPSAQPVGDLRLYREGYEWCADGWYGGGHEYNGQSLNAHYVVRNGSDAHRLLFPESETDTEETEDMNTEEHEEEPDNLVEVVVSGYCECYNNYSSRFSGKSSDFETDILPEDDDDVVWLEREKCYASRSGCVLQDTEDGDTSFRENCTRLDCGGWYHNDEISHDGHGNAYHNCDEDYVYCSDEGESYHRDECHYCSDEQEWRYGEEDDCSHCQRESGSDDHVNEYHHSPDPEFYKGSAPSGWGIGFEVEKTDIDGVDDEGGYVGSSPLFAGWERDASCGVEGITHVYDPLTMAETFYAHASNSRRWLDAATDASCGGHINISRSGITPRHLLQSMRTYAPLWYAIYRNRLNNSYCRDDKKVEHGTTKYSPLRTKEFGVELRLPPAVRNRDQLVRRFDMMALCCLAIDQGWSLNRYIKECRPLLFVDVYGKNRTKYAHILRLARHFDRWFKDGHIHASIVDYV